MRQSHATRSSRTVIGILSLICAISSAAPHQVASIANAQDPFALGVRDTEPLTPEQEQATFKLPPGFRIELVAAEPQIYKPMNVACDVYGRLWVTDSIEYPYAAPSDREGRDTIKVLEDRDGDGRFETVTTFADGLNIPIGVYPTLDGCIAWSIPNIWYLRDTDGDLKCDERIELYGPMGFERDTHGMNNSFTRGFDGWLNACHGFNNETSVAGRDGHRIRMQSGNTYRMRLDGERIEQYTWGQVNPFGMTIDRWGHLYTADCHSKPVYQLVRGGYYPSFGKPHDGLGFVPPIMEHLHGSTAIAGVALLETDSVPESLRGHLLSGNVMTSRINHNRLEINGVSRLAIEEPDFLSTTDPWFRPVDIKLGSDGAIYVCDFYNRIIGHYEVPLTHPGRDRERGRLWRIWYDAGDSQAKPKQLPNLAALNDAELIDRLASANLTERLLVLNLLCDRSSMLALDTLKQLQAIVGDVQANEDQRIAAAWILERKGELSDDLMQTVASKATPALLTHLTKILSERPNWGTVQWSMAQAAITHASAEVQAAVADALAQRLQHPIAPDQTDRTKWLLDLLVTSRQVPANDPMLKHGLRIAIKQLLASWPTDEALDAKSIATEDLSELAIVCLAVPSEAAAEVLHSALARDVPLASLVDSWKHVATHARVELLEQLIREIPDRFSGELELQFDLMLAIERGLRERGTDPTQALKQWGHELAVSLLTGVSDDAAWFNEPIDHAAQRANPWTIEKRRCADGIDDRPFLTTLAKGEQFVGRLHSPSFVAGDSFVFWCAGHCGYPDQPFAPKNFLRLIDADTRQVLLETTPPRNDTAQRFEWDTSPWKGKRVMFEALDADEAGAYAWLSVGRFETPQVQVPAGPPRDLSERLIRASLLIGQFQLTDLRQLLVERLQAGQLNQETSLRLLEACVSTRPDPVLQIVAPWYRHPSLPDAWQRQLDRRLNRGPLSDAEQEQAERRQLLDPLVLSLDAVGQQRLTERGVGSPEATRILVDLWERGRLSTRLLAQQQLAARVLASASEEDREKIRNWKSALPPLSAEIEERISQRKALFLERGGDIAAGQALFTKHCAACHQVAGAGAVVGPQLDGIGLRGLDRITEDLFDPNRNVDVAFRTTLIETEDGATIAGLIKLESETTVTLVDNQGKEIVIDVPSIVAKQESELSLMPETLAQDIPEAELLDLLAYLMSQKTAPEERE